MRDFFLSNGQLLVWILAVAEIALAIWAFAMKNKDYNILGGLICAGLAVDAVVIGLGSVVGAGDFMQTLSQVRYILHGILVPLLIPISFYGFGMKKKIWKTIIWIVTGVVIAGGIAMGIMIKTEPVEIAGIIRYASSELTPAFADKMELVLSFGGVIPLILMGFLHLIMHKRPCLLLSGIFMFAFSALGPATGNMDLIFIITMIGEVLMVLFIDLELSSSK